MTFPLRYLRMRVLYVFDYSIPLQVGYTFRSLSLLTE